MSSPELLPLADGLGDHGEEPGEREEDGEDRGILHPVLGVAADRGGAAPAGARQLHAGLVPAVRGLMTRTQGAITAKAALQLQGVLAHRTMRLPLVEATDAEVEQLRDDLAGSDLL